jgi:hypothetical protein
MNKLKSFQLHIAVLLCILVLAIFTLPGCSKNRPVQTIESVTTTTVTVTESVSVTVSGMTEKEKMDLIDRTIAYQTDGNVYHADNYEVVKLDKGNIIYGLLPGQSVFYTDRASLEAGQGSYKTLYRLLQIRPHPVYGYRTKAGKYEVQADIYVAAGTCRANREIIVDGKTEIMGDGGGYQYVIFDFTKNLKLLEEIELHE